MTNSTSVKFSDELTQSAKKLAPWSSGLSWWVILIEGIVLGIVGLLVVLDPAKTNIRIGLVLSLALFVAGLLQCWMLFRERAPESVDGIIGARAALGIFSGLLVLWLFVGGTLTAEVGLLILGLGALCYGVLGVFLILNSLGGQRNSALLETVFFSAFGLIVLYTRYAGASAVETGVAAIGWLALLTGVGLAVYAFIRRGREENVEQAVPPAETSVGS